MTRFLLIPALLTGYFCDRGLDRLIHPPKYPRTVYFSFLAFAVLYFSPGTPAERFQGFLFAQMLIAAGHVDRKTREIPNVLIASIFLVSLIRPDLKMSLFGAVFLSAPLWILGTLIPGSVGGGDIKLIAACGAVLGPAGIFAGTAFSLIAFLFFLLFRFMLHKKRQKTYAMAPWLGIGCFLAYFLKMR